MPQKNFRRRRASSSSSNEGNKGSADEESSTKADDVNAVLEKAAYIRECQKLRQRPTGITLDKLAFDKTKSKQSEQKESKEIDPFNLKTGGLLDTKKMMKRKVEDLDEEGEETISKLFAAETNRRDEDTDMVKYIEEELSKRRGDKKEEDLKQQQATSSTGDVLNKVPDYLRPSIGKASEGMMSQQMLCGIPEVDLGVEAKMKNIEATEEAKQKLIKERLEAAQRGKDVSDLVPTNVAVNFVQHSRWKDHAEVAAKMESVKKARQRAEFEAQAEEIKKTFRVGDYENIVENEKRKMEKEKSSDGFHLQRFKRQMQNRKK